MSFLDVLRYRLRVFSRPRSHEREVAEEVEFHVDLETMHRTHASRGELPPPDARAAARRRFGNPTYYREETRRVSGLAFLDTLQQDARFAVRTLRRAPSFTAVAVLTLAIGIGATTAIFSAVDALLLRPLPFRDADRLMSLKLTRPALGAPRDRDIVWSYPKFTVLREAQTVFSSVTEWTETQFTVRATDEGVRTSGEYIDSRYVTTLGIAPALGRNFHADEDRAGAGAHVTMVSDELWRGLFSADPAVVGRTLDVDGVPYTVVGVLPAGFRGLSGDATFWMPLVSAPADWGAVNPYNHSFFAIGRLNPGVSPEQAASVVRTLGARIDAAFPDRDNTSVHWGAVARTLDDVRVVEGVRRTLLILLGAVGVVLLIACANVANLFLVRASGRRREIAVRLAIGAGRRRLVRQLLVESMLLSALGGAAGVAVAWLGVKGLVILQPTFALGAQSSAGIGASTFGAITLDLSALGFAAALALGTGLAFGLLPALQSTRPSLTEALKSDGAARSRRARRFTSRNALTVIEIALAVVLLAGSGVLIRSLAQLLGVRPGFDADHVLTMRINRAPAWSRDSLTTFYDRSIAELAAVPGVLEVAIGDIPPANGGFAATGVEIVGGLAAGARCVRLVLSAAVQLANDDVRAHARRSADVHRRDARDAAPGGAGVSGL